MSNYAVNCSIPKTLVRHLVAYLARGQRGEGRRPHRCAGGHPGHPRVPGAAARRPGEISQRTEDLVGPYELHDFFLYYMLRWGFPPRKIYRLAVYALGKTYSRDVILKWLKVFYRRFFSQQFKRSCVRTAQGGLRSPVPPRRLADAQRRKRRTVDGRAGGAGVTGTEEPVALLWSPRRAPRGGERRSSETSELSCMAGKRGMWSLRRRGGCPATQAPHCGWQSWRRWNKKRGAGRRLFFIGRRSAAGGFGYDDGPPVSAGKCGLMAAPSGGGIWLPPGAVPTGVRPPFSFWRHQKENAPRPVEEKKCSAGQSAPAQTSCRRRGKVGPPAQ